MSTRAVAAEVEYYPPRPRNRLILLLWGVTISIAVLWPFWLVLLNPGSQEAFMLRDMMIPRTMPLNALAAGMAPVPPRALPQDAVLSMFFSTNFPATWTAAIAIVATAIAGVIFTGRLVERMAGAGVAVQMAVSLFVVWNPFSAERLLQGHWSLVLAMWALPALAYTSAAGLRGPQLSLIAACSLTPTGWLFALVIACLFDPTLRARLTTIFALACCSMPWVLVWIVNKPGMAVSAESAALFAPRAEPLVGTFGSLLGLGGIWNAAAMPPSRGALAALVSVLLAMFILLGARALWRVYPAVAVLTAAAILLPWFFSTPVGVHLMGWMISTVPGAGLFRDSQKFVALAVPGLVLAFADALQRTGQALATRTRWPDHVGARLVAIPAAALVIFTVPLFPTDVSPLRPHPIKAEWTQVTNAISAAPDSNILLLPPGSYRMRYGYPVVDPALKLLPGTPIDPSFLQVDGKIVDGEPWAMSLLSDTMHGEDRLAQSGVGWVIVDRSSIPEGMDTTAMDALLSNHQLSVDGEDIELYRIVRPEDMSHRRSVVPLSLGLLMYWGIASLGFILSVWTAATYPVRRRSAASESQKPAKAEPLNG